MKFVSEVVKCILTKKKIIFSYVTARTTPPFTPLRYASGVRVYNMRVYHVRVRVYARRISYDGPEGRGEGGDGRGPKRAKSMRPLPPRRARPENGGKTRAAVYAYAAAHIRPVTRQPSRQTPAEGRERGSRGIEGRVAV